MSAPFNPTPAEVIAGVAAKLTAEFWPAIPLFAVAVVLYLLLARFRCRPFRNRRVWRFRQRNPLAVRGPESERPKPIFWPHNPRRQ